MAGKLLRAAMVALIAVGSASLAPSARADEFPHTGPPPDEDFVLSGPPGAVCTVQGDVSLNPGISATPVHRHFVFVDTTIDCRSTDPNLAGPFKVTVKGHIDGPDDPTTIDVVEHGGACGDAWGAGDDGVADPWNNTFTGFHEVHGNLSGWNRFHTTTAYGVHAWGEFVGANTGQTIEYEFFGRTLVPDDAQMSGAERIARACGLNDGTTITKVNLPGVAIARIK